MTMPRTMPLLLVLLLASAARADEETEAFKAFYDAQFKAFPAPQAALKAKAKLQWEKDPKARRYRTALQRVWAEAKEPNFAGHFYAVKDIGCGTGCEVIFVIDWNTGAIYYPPMDNYFEVRKDSRLLIQKPYEFCSAYGPPVLLEFTGKRFREVKHDRCQTPG